MKNLPKQLEKEVKLYKIMKIKVENFERCLNALDETERSIIERKLLTNEVETDLAVYLDIGIKKDKYYQKKRDAYLTFAAALGIIKEGVF